MTGSASPLTLYVKAGCPYCAYVQRALERLRISATEKDIADPSVAAELVARGGKRQVPYLVDVERGVEMYESEDIAAYLSRRFGLPVEAAAKAGSAPQESASAVCPE